MSVRSAHNALCYRVCSRKCRCRGNHASLRRAFVGWHKDATFYHTRLEPLLDRASEVGARVHLFQERCLIDLVEAAGDICIEHISWLLPDHLKNLLDRIVA